MDYVQHATIYTPDQIIDDGAIVIDDRRIVAVGAASQIPIPPAPT